MSDWIDFKQLRRQLSFEAVLRHYGLEPKAGGEQYQCFCPLPGHGGKRRSPSFSANLARGIFQCFGCGARGNALEFAALMEGVDPQDGKALRRIASDLARRFCPQLCGPGKGNAPAAAEAEEDSESPVPSEAAVNVPLDFELKGLDAAHPYLLRRGFSPDTVARFGLGFASRGSLRGRLAIPLHRQDGALVGYAGRVVEDAAITPDNPRYRFPGRREREGIVHEFRKSLFLYNGFRTGGPVEDLIVAEGFAAVWWLEQHGLAPAVATMGSDCSEQQAELIVSLVRPNGRVWLMPDGDAAGLRHAESVLSKVSPHRFIRWVRLDGDRQPTDLDPGELHALLSF